ncbi:MAG TPA: dynamin family protein [Acidimicrobiales bacterium]|nr:dynamin family protein [Acidimicrobiales bacterium]
MPAPANADHADLEQAARRLVTLCRGRPDLAERAQRLAERIATQRFHVAVLGEFKRGKSTVVNALIGQELLPSGVVPLTAVATEVHFGIGHSTVVFADGRRLPIDQDEIAGYVTERENPGNGKAVARVEVGTHQAFGTPGVVLVDTPGVASVNQHNTAVARDLLSESDAAVLVLSADSPLSESDLDILAELEARREKVFVVVNKSDHLADDEIEEVEEFVVEHLRRASSQWSGPYCTDARSALRGGPVAPGRAAAGFVAFRAALERFIGHDLASARREAAVAELGRLAQRLDQAFQLEAAAGALDADALRSQLARFEGAVSDGRRALDEDRVVLDHEVARLATAVGQRLAQLAAAAARSCRSELAPAAGAVPVRRLDDALRRAVEECVQRELDPIRRAVDNELDGAWELIASRFTDRVRGRISELIGVANDLFDVHLPAASVPPVAGQRERFSYLFVRVESPTAPIGRLLGLLLPPGLARRRARRSAERRLVQELDKHVGRARYDLVQRLEGAENELVAAMVADYEETQSSLVRAVQGARSLLTLSEEERAGRDHRRDEVRALVAEIGQLANHAAS